MAKRRYLRISLRTLLLVTTACAIWLGYLSKRAHDQRAAVRRIAELGGAFMYDHHFARDANGKRDKSSQPSGWPWLRRLIGDEYFQQVLLVDLDDTAVTDNDLRLIGKLDRLVILGLNETDISDLSTIRNLRRLRYLGLWGTKINGDDLRHLEWLGDLNTLILQDVAGVDDAALRYLKPLQRLDTLNLNGTSVSSKGIRQLTVLKRLQWLMLEDTVVSDDAAAALRKMTGLAELDVSNTDISGTGLVKLRESLPSCKIEADVFDLASQCWYDLDSWKLYTTRLRALNDEDRLTLVDLKKAQIADDHLPALYGLDRVDAIDLRHTKVTAAGVEDLRRALPECDVLADERVEPSD